jgi:hypothetical protein
MGTLHDLEKYKKEHPNRIVKKSNKQTSQTKDLEPVVEKQKKQIAKLKTEVKYYKQLIGSLAVVEDLKKKKK